MAFLRASEIAYATEFTLIELYGGAHLTFFGDVVAITAVSLVGDDTGYIHIPPQQVLRLSEVRVNEFNYVWSVWHCNICKVLKYQVFYIFKVVINQHWQIENHWICFFPIVLLFQHWLKMLCVKIIFY